MIDTDISNNVNWSSPKSSNYWKHEIAKFMLSVLNSTTSDTIWSPKH